MAKNDKLQSLDSMRGLMTLMVVLAHINAIIVSNLFHGIFVQGSCGVDFFFTLSGFLLYYNYRESENRLSDAVVYIKKRFLRIYPAYWVYTAIAFFMITSYDRKLITWTELGRMDILRSILCLVKYRSGSVAPIIPPAWTLSYEVFFYIVGLSLILGGTKVFRNVLAVWTVAIALFAVISDGKETVPFLFNTLFLEFIMGVCAASFIKKNVISKKLTIPSLVLGLTLLMFFWVGKNLELSYVLSVNRVASFGVPFAMIIFGLVQFERCDGRAIRSKLLSHFSRISYSLYLTHYIVIVMLIQVFNARCPDAPSEFKFLIAVLACLIVGEITYFLVEKNVVSLSGRLLKNRWVSIGLAAVMILAYLFAALVQIFQ